MNKDNEENLKIFENIGSHEILSRYSGELDRVFKDRSFNKFYGDLVANRHHKSDDLSRYYGEDENKRFNTYTETRKFNIKKFRKFIKELDIEEEKEREKIRTYRNQFKITKQEDKKIKKEKDEKRKKIIKSRVFFKYPDMGKYRPNYKAISKNLPNIYLSRYEFDPNKKYPIEGRDLFPIKKEKEPIKLMKSTSKLLSDSNDETEITVSKTLEVSPQKSNKFFGRNNVMKFDCYTSRKPLIVESITKDIVSTLDLPSSCSPRYIKGLIEFNRMSSDIENTKFIPDPDKIKDPNPPLGMYKPNYRYLENNYRDIYIKRHPVINPHSKIKKIMYEYKVPMEYQIVHKLNNQTSY